MGQLSQPFLPHPVKVRWKIRQGFAKISEALVISRESLEFQMVCGDCQKFSKKCVAQRRFIDRFCVRFERIEAVNY
jgi:hypothetical protein